MLQLNNETDANRRSLHRVRTYFGYHKLWNEDRGGLTFLFGRRFMEAQRHLMVIQRFKRAAS